MKNVLISGGTGFIGKKLTKALQQKGFSVFILTRDKNKKYSFDEPFPKCIEFSEKNTEELLEIGSNSEAIVNLAGASIAGSKWTKEYKKLILESRIQSTNLIVNAIKKMKTAPKCFISASAVGYYGSRADEILTEEAKPGSDFLANVCLEWEKAAFGAEHLCRTVIPRIGVVLDKNEGALPQMIKPFKVGFSSVPGNGKQWVPWIHIADLVNLFVWSVENEKIRGKVNCVAPNAVQMSQLTKSIGKILKKAVIGNVPEFALKLMLGEQAAIVLGSTRAVPKVAIEKNFKFTYLNVEVALEDFLK